FLLSYSLPHLDLHSFPTRRSSDLIANQVEPTFVLLRYSLGGYRPSKTSRLPVSLSRLYGQRLVIPVPKGGVSLLALRSPKGPLRSEEHTSELQSLAYLVCRLLLEK